MKLATLKNGSRDGRLVVVSRDLTRAVDAAAIAPTLQFAIEHWSWVEAGLRGLSDALNAGGAPAAFAFDPTQAMAPLPRTHQFVDASAFLNHGDIMERAFNLTIKRPEGVPILVQRQSDDFCGPRDDYPLLGSCRSIHRWAKRKTAASPTSFPISPPKFPPTWRRAACSRKRSKRHWAS